MAMTFQAATIGAIVLQRLRRSGGFTGRYGRVGQCVTRGADRRARRPFVLRAIASRGR